MSKFKIGDVIRLIDYSKYEYPIYKGQSAVIVGYASGSGFDYRIQWDNGSYSCVYESNIDFNSQINQTTMNIKEKFALAFKSEPEKSFRKAGITNGDDFLTAEGQEIFLGWLLQKHGTEFKTEVVDELLKEENKSLIK